MLRSAVSHLGRDHNCAGDFTASSVAVAVLVPCFGKGAPEKFRGGQHRVIGSRRWLSFMEKRKLASLKKQ